MAKKKKKKKRAARRILGTGVSLVICGGSWEDRTKGYLNYIFKQR